VIGRHPFVAVLREQRARLLAVGSVVARLREAGTSLAIVLVLRHAEGSFAVAGAGAAACLAGGAVSRPLHGRWVDRAGMGRALVVPSIANGIALVALAVVADRRGGELTLLALAAVVGLTLPALSAALRAAWPRLVPDLADHGYAFDTLLYEFSLITAPTIVAFVAATTSPELSLVSLAVAGLAGTLLVVHASGADMRIGRRCYSDRRALLSVTVAALVLVALFVGLAEGSLTVIVPGVASHHRVPAASGLLLSCLSVGSLVGAIGYASLTQIRWPRRLVASIAALVVTLVALGALGSRVVVLGAVLVAVGLALAPTLTTGFIALERVAPAAALTEAFTWASFSASAGAAAGQALAGALISGPGLGIALWEPVCGAFAALVVAVFLARNSTRERASCPGTRH
jgi:predicted MFS family arabinose efflux permease